MNAATSPTACITDEEARVLKELVTKIIDQMEQQQYSFWYLVLMSTIGCLLAAFVEFLVKDFWMLAKDVRRGRGAQAEQEGIVGKQDA